MTDNVDHPAHYNKGGIETIKIIDEICAYYPGDEAFSIGCTIKYLSRAPHKQSKIEDLKKAAWYLNHAIEVLEARTAADAANVTSDSPR